MTNLSILGRCHVCWWPVNGIAEPIVVDHVQLNVKYMIRFMALTEINRNQYICYTTLEDGKNGVSITICYRFPDDSITLAYDITHWKTQDTLLQNYSK